jgi:hypothetical protein
VRHCQHRIRSERQDDHHHALPVICDQLRVASRVPYARQSHARHKYDQAAHSYAMYCIPANPATSVHISDIRNSGSQRNIFLSAGAKFEVMRLLTGTPSCFVVSYLSKFLVGCHHEGSKISGISEVSLQFAFAPLSRFK